MGKISLNRNQIKYLVIIAMTIDHIAWAFVNTASVEGQLMHFIGRLTGPVMAYFITEGYIHTRNIKKYALRMGVFAIISWMPFSLFSEGAWPTAYMGVIYTLFLGLIAIWVWDKLGAPEWVKKLIVIGLCIISIIGDWPIVDVLCPWLLFVYRDDEKKKWKVFWGVGILDIMLFGFGGYPLWTGIYNLGVFMAIALLQFCYSGKKGSNRPVHKWFFYVYYPAHLLILYLLKLLVA